MVGREGNGIPILFYYWVKVANYGRSNGVSESKSSIEPDHGRPPGAVVWCGGGVLRVRHVYSHAGNRDDFDQVVQVDGAG